MELRTLGLHRYKGYAESTEIELAPLTILVGANNSGKTALAQVISLLAGGLVPSDADSTDPLPPVSGGIHHGQTFEDLVTGRAVHGRLRLSATLADGSDELSLSATVGNVVSTSNFRANSTVDTPLATRLSERHVFHWHLVSHDRTIALDRQGFDRDSDYEVRVEGTEPAALRQVNWRGLVPSRPNELAEWLGAKVDALKIWALGVRHLQSPRNLLPTPLLVPERPTVNLGPTREKTPLALAADDGLRDSVLAPKSTGHAQDRFL